MKQWSRDVRPYVFDRSDCSRPRLINMTIPLREIGSGQGGGGLPGRKMRRRVARRHVPGRNYFRDRGYSAIFSLSEDGDMQDSLFRRSATARSEAGPGAVG